MDDECPKGGEHRWKFNGGNPMCPKCGEYRDGYTQRVFPAIERDDGTIYVHDLLARDAGACAEDQHKWQVLAVDRQPDGPLAHVRQRCLRCGAWDDYYVRRVGSTRVD